MSMEDQEELSDMKELTKRAILSHQGSFDESTVALVLEQRPISGNVTFSEHEPPHQVDCQALQPLRSCATQWTMVVCPEMAQRK